MPQRVLQGLPDYVTSDLRVLFVGINPGVRSAEVGHHFAGHSNRFWKLLADSHLVPHPLNYREDARLLEWGIGLTNLVTRPTTGAHALTQEEYQRGRVALLRKIKRFHPKIVSLLGIGMAKDLLSEWTSDECQSTADAIPIKPGLQQVCLHQTQVFVMPNPSGRNAHYSYQVMSRLFQDLGRMVHSLG